MNKTVSKLNILISASADGALATYRRVESETGKLANAISGQLGSLPFLKFASLSGVVSGAVGAAYAALGKLKEGFAANESLAATSREFRALTGSAGAAKSLLEDLGRLELEGALFDLDGNVAQAAKTLLRFRIPAADIVDTVRDLGAISAATGTPLEELADKYGRLAVGPINLKKLVGAAEAGIPVISELSKQFGVSTQELAKLISEGKVGFDDVRTALQSLTSETGDFGTALNDQLETTTGQLQKLERSIDNIFEAISGALTPVLDKVLPMVTRFTDEFSKIPPVLTIGALNPLAGAVVLWEELTGSAEDAGKAQSAAFRDLSSAAENASNSQSRAVDALLEISELATSESLEEEIKKLEDFKKRGDAITRQNRTAFEVFDDTVKDLNQLLDVGAIQAQTYERAIAEAKQQFAEATKESDRLTESVRQLAGVGVAERGTTAGFSAVQSGTRALFAMRESEARELARSNKLQADILSVLTASKRRLDEIATKKPVELQRGEL